MYRLHGLFAQREWFSSVILSIPIRFLDLRFVQLNLPLAPGRRSRRPQLIFRRTRRRTEHGDLSGRSLHGRVMITTRLRSLVTPLVGAGLKEYENAAVPLMVTAFTSPPASVKEPIHNGRVNPPNLFQAISLPHHTRSQTYFDNSRCWITRRQQTAIHHFSPQALSSDNLPQSPSTPPRCLSTAVPRQPTSDRIYSQACPPRSVDGPAVEVAALGVSFPLSPEKSVQFGINCYYCPRCASMVGYKR
ncbi:hypothetical protein CIHG_04242 [Coccidioides immitis H538.4]|uniref:Uncharacterized protein n=1 Tax=Coccidioides immitis H538.4 TaxID=396776 RepID=A0A0J8UGC7_COCIT|nr:hypothetical protein CIHG_04242 [Coccidioides immitis H538.4]